jgi:hypothetical protein
MGNGTDRLHLNGVGNLFLVHLFRGQISSWDPSPGIGG